MSSREERRQDAEVVALGALKLQRKPWTSARDLARATGRPWRSMARALLRMVAHGSVQEHIIDWHDERFRARQTRLYRAQVSFNVKTWPESLMPRVKTSLQSSARKAQVAKSKAALTDR